MRQYVALALTLLAGLSAAAQQPPAPPSESDDIRLEVTGCVDGSTLTESNLNYNAKGREGADPAGQWRLSASREAMRQIRDHARKELRVVGLVKRKDARGTVIADRRVGERARVYVGKSPTQGPREARMIPPTLRVEAFAQTANDCS